MEKYLTEFVGTLIFVATISLAVITESAMAPLAIGGILMVMIYMGGHISGGHYNPAVSLGLMMRGALPASELVPYWAAQILGGIVGALLGNFIGGGSVPIAPGDGVNVAQAMISEILFTFALALVVMNVATVNKDGVSGNSYYGLAIGFVIVCAAFAAGGISGGAWNPAVGTGLSVGALIAGSGGGWIWLYIVGPLIGGALAAVVFKAQGNE